MQQTVLDSEFRTVKKSLMQAYTNIIKHTLSYTEECYTRLKKLPLPSKRVLAVASV